MEWIEHDGSYQKREWNPNYGRVTALQAPGSGIYAEVVVENEPGNYSRWNNDTFKMEPIPNVSTMEEAQAVCTALYKMGE